MRYVQRENGKIVGSFARPQLGLAEEALPDDDPELLEFIKRPDPVCPENVVSESYRSALHRQADELANDGPLWEAVKLLLMAKGE